MVLKWCIQPTLRIVANTGAALSIVLQCMLTQTLHILRNKGTVVTSNLPLIASEIASAAAALIGKNHLFIMYAPLQMSSRVYPADVDTTLGATSIGINLSPMF